MLKEMLDLLVARCVPTIAVTEWLNGMNPNIELELDWGVFVEGTEVRNEKKNEKLCIENSRGIFYHL
jgi:hypothetical protein